MKGLEICRPQAMEGKLAHNVELKPVLRNGVTSSSKPGFEHSELVKVCIDKMWSKSVKVSESGSRVILNPKRKQGYQILKKTRNIDIIGSRPHITSLLNKLGKRKRDESNTKCSVSNKTLLKNYSNFKKSGIPKRLLFSQDGQWNDYPQGVVDLVKEDFLTKKLSVEVKFNGRHLTLDFLNMTEVDLETGVQKPIAWIDEKGSCFFPELYSIHQCNNKSEENIEFESSEIKLHVEIELSNNIFEECMGESDGHESNFKKVKVDRSVENIQQNDETAGLETVRNMFMKGVNVNSAFKVDIIDVKQCCDGIMEAKLELFQKQVEITKKIRGNANVKYGWFACTTDATCGNAVNGLGHNGPKLGRYVYGVHMTAVDSPHNSVAICDDDDEKGIKCMMLCRVILGNTEVVLPGSKQFYPSDESFDTGVDNLQNPNHYVIWDMNVNSHIYPEYSVTFKISPTAQDSVEKVAPKSPWIPFSKLFEGISDKVAANDMQRVHVLYESLKGKKTSREEFIRNLRAIVGDQILRSAISSLQSTA